jgi:hypothetical protein
VGLPDPVIVCSWFHLVRTTVAAALAMETGGIVPGRAGQAVPAILHAGEGIIPERNMRDAGGIGNTGGHTFNFHYNPALSAIDAKGMSDVLRSHSADIAGIFRDELRRSNLI